MRRLAVSTILVQRGSLWSEFRSESFSIQRRSRDAIVSTASRSHAVETVDPARNLEFFSQQFFRLRQVAVTVEGYSESVHRPESINILDSNNTALNFGHP